MNRRKPPIPALSRRAALVGAAQAVALLAAACTQAPAPASPGPLTPAPTEPPALGQSPTPAPLTPPAATATSPALTPAARATPVAGAAAQARACAATLPAVIPPTPIPYPGYTQQEPSTGLHVTAEPQIVDVATYRLEVKGKVARELSLTYDELRCLPRIGGYVRIECPGYFIDFSNLAGASLVSVLELAGPLEDAKRVRFIGVDGRTESVSLAEAHASEYFLAYEWEGESLPVSHGFPVRAALPDTLGGSWVKWLMAIEIA